MAPGRSLGHQIIGNFGGIGSIKGAWNGVRRSSRIIGGVRFVGRVQVEFGKKVALLDIWPHGDYPSTPRNPVGPLRSIWQKAGLVVHDEHCESHDSLFSKAKGKFPFLRFAHDEKWKELSIIPELTHRDHSDEITRSRDRLRHIATPCHPTQARRQVAAGEYVRFERTKPYASMKKK
jgi:hypothetical protein